MDSLHWLTEKRKVAEILPWEGNPRKISDEQVEQLKRSLERFNLVEIPAIDTDNRLIAGHQRIKILLALGRGEEEIDVRVPNRKLTMEEFEEYNVRSNLTTGEFDWEMLAKFDESFLSDVGFSSQELDRIFDVEDTPETFDLQKELEKLDINEIEIKKGDVWALGDSRLMCGDSTVEAEFQKLMGSEKADMCMTDPPYILDYLKGKKKHGDPVTGFGYKRDRRYLETESLPDNFTELWMNSVAASAKPNFAIIVFENWKNIRTIWDEMEKRWKVKNMIVWHLENRHQGFSSKYRFFNKHDIAMVGASGDVPYNNEPEDAPLQEEYETALYAISGKPQWESYEKGKKNCPTDFIEFRSSDEKHSGQGVIFGTKPTEILIPYIKMLTKRGDLVIEPFGGSGSTLIASTKLKRRCFLMEKSPVYAEVIRKRWENLTGLKATRISYGD
ncbi:MAG: DNA methyltransferase [Patescibacteria group bacterium]|nr:MAG: DNA methyltransferase [Patescibacteria group bacterium]